MATARRLTEEDRAVITEVEGMIDTLIRNDPKLTKAECLRKFLPFHPSVWSKLTSEEGYAGAIEVKLGQCRQAIREMEDYLANAAHHRTAKRFHWLQKFQAVLDAVAIAKTVENENRLILFLAPTGGGKSELCRQLAASKSASIIEAKESWRNSYFAGCHDVCAAVGARGKAASKQEVERKMLATLLCRDHLLAIDEGATAFGAPTANMVKLILNQTHSTVVLCGTPELSARMMKSSEGQQLMRRCLVVVRSETITPREAKAFLPYRFNDEAGSLQTVCNAANGFGMFDLVSRIHGTLSADHEDGDTIEFSEVKKAIELARAQMGQ
jgi:type II secretory pathway predicted ATPase ExeA